jgi:hypothetical protein
MPELLCISSFKKSLPLHTNFQHAIYGNRFTVSSLYCEHCYDWLGHNFALINNSLPTPSSRVVVDRRSYSDKPNGLKRRTRQIDGLISPLMSASRLHFFYAFAEKRRGA